MSRPAISRSSAAEKSRTRSAKAGAAASTPTSSSEVNSPATCRPTSTAGRSNEVSVSVNGRRSLCSASTSAKAAPSSAARVTPSACAAARSAASSSRSSRALCRPKRGMPTVAGSTASGSPGPGCSSAARRRSSARRPARSWSSRARRASTKSRNDGPVTGGSSTPSYSWPHSVSTCRMLRASRMSRSKLRCSRVPPSGSSEIRTSKTGPVYGSCTCRDIRSRVRSRVPVGSGSARRSSTATGDRSSGGSTRWLPSGRMTARIMSCRSASRRSAAAARSGSSPRRLNSRYAWVPTPPSSKPAVRPAR